MFRRYAALVATNAVVVPVTLVVVLHEVMIPEYSIQAELLTQFTESHSPPLPQLTGKVGDVQQLEHPCMDVLSTPHTEGLYANPGYVLMVGEAQLSEMEICTALSDSNPHQVCRPLAKMVLTVDEMGKSTVPY